MRSIQSLVLLCAALALVGHCAAINTSPAALNRQTERSSHLRQRFRQMNMGTLFESETKCKANPQAGRPSQPVPTQKSQLPFSKQTGRGKDGPKVGPYPAPSPTAGTWDDAMKKKVQDSWVYALQQRNIAQINMNSVTETHTAAYSILLTMGAAANFYGCHTNANQAMNKRFGDIDAVADQVTKWKSNPRVNPLSNLSGHGVTPAANTKLHWGDLPGCTDKGYDERPIQLYMPPTLNTASTAPPNDVKYFEVDVFQTPNELHSPMMQAVAKEFMPLGSKGRKIKKSDGKTMDLLRIVPCQALVDLKAELLEQPARKAKKTGKNMWDQIDMKCLCNALPNYGKCKSFTWSVNVDGVTEADVPTATGC